MQNSNNKWSPQFRIHIHISQYFHKIEKAKKGIPTSGKLPYGRTYDNGWGLDDEKVQKITWAANEYLKGKSLTKLSTALNMNMSNLWKILTQRSGDKWEIHYRSKQFNIDERVEISVPRLLPQVTIDLIHKKAEANKTYNHGHIKHKYLLARTVFCSDCGYAMFGQTNHNGRRYYRHFRHGVKECGNVSFWVRADHLENAVLVHLFSMYGDIENMEKAMIRAIPKSSEVTRLRNEMQILEIQLEKTHEQTNRIVKSIAEGTIDDAEAKASIQNIREQKRY